MARRSDPSALMKAIIDKTGGTLEGSVLSLSELKKREYGMPLRHFCLQYIFSCSSIKAGSTIMLQGPPQTCKSPLLFYLLRENCLSLDDGGFGGVSWLDDLEDKLSYTLLKAFADKPYMTDLKEASTLQVFKHSTINEAIQRFEARIKAYRDNNPNNDVPIMWGVDSIGGASTEEHLKKAAEAQAEGRGFSDKSLVLSNFFNTYSALVRSIPIITVCVNHEKPTVASTTGAPVPGFTRGHATGGEAQKFKASVNLRISGKAFYNKMGSDVTIHTYKNSNGSEVKITTQFQYDYPDPVTGSRNHRWNFAATTADLLAAPPEGVKRADVHDLVGDITIAKQSGLVTAPKLGLKSEPPEVLEKMLLQDKNLLTPLQMMYSIQQIQSLDDRLDAVEQEKKEAKEAQKESKKAVKTSKNALPPVTVPSPVVQQALI